MCICYKTFDHVSEKPERNKVLLRLFLKSYDTPCIAVLLFPSIQFVIFFLFYPFVDEASTCNIKEIRYTTN